VVQVAAIVGLVYLGSKILGANPPRGLRGGIFIVLSTLFTAFFIWRAVGMNFAGSTGTIAAGIAGLVVIFGAFKFLTSERARNWMHMLEDHGWFSTFSYKKTQGQRMRRYTIIGILLIGLSGVWSMLSHNMFAGMTNGRNDLLLFVPVLEQSLPVLTDMRFSIPLLTAVVVPFADFLIATEAEMNKVSWTPRKRLMQDTIVVLVTTLLLTAFLLVIDLFWGWLLSQSWVGVLPNKEELAKKAKQDPTATKSTW
jgi:preprotein translocase SecE subunit